MKFFIMTRTDMLSTTGSLPNICARTRYNSLHEDYQSFRRRAELSGAVSAVGTMGMITQRRGGINRHDFRNRLLPRSGFTRIFRVYSHVPDSLASSSDIQPPRRYTGIITLNDSGISL
jgi:hypothetical protein